MKVQMQGQSMRLRIDETELSRLQAGQVVGNLTRFPGGACLCLAVRQVESLSPVLLTTDGGWRLDLPRGLLEPYVARLPCREGLRLDFPAGGERLEVGFEVDVRDSVRIRGVAGRSGARRDLTGSP